MKHFLSVLILASLLAYDFFLWNCNKQERADNVTLANRIIEVAMAAQKEKFSPKIENWLEFANIPDLNFVGIEWGPSESGFSAKGAYQEQDFVLKFNRTLVASELSQLKNILQEALVLDNPGGLDHASSHWNSELIIGKSSSDTYVVFDKNHSEKYRYKELSVAVRTKMTVD